MGRRDAESGEGSGEGSGERSGERSGDGGGERAPGDGAAVGGGTAAGTGRGSDARAGRSVPSGLRLIIGNRNYSSWSLRPWILMRHAGFEFEEVRVPLTTEAGARLMDELCPAGKVPVLNDGPLVLWDSLAICEYIADKARGAAGTTAGAAARRTAGSAASAAPVASAASDAASDSMVAASADAGVALWPEPVERRAEARAMSAEMHAGFAALRASMPMNCRREVGGFAPDFDTRTDIDRLVDLIESARSRSRARADGPWLFGRYSVADAMFAPIASRFRTYGISVPPDTRAWIDTTLDDPPMREWYALAAAETETIEKFEIPDR